MNDYQTATELEPIDGKKMALESEEPIMIVNGKFIFSSRFHAEARYYLRRSCIGPYFNQTKLLSDVWT